MNDVSQVVLVYPSPRMSFDRSNQLVAKALWVCLTERILFLINCELRNVYSTSLKPMHACALFSQGAAYCRNRAEWWGHGGNTNRDMSYISSVHLGKGGKEQGY